MQREYDYLVLMDGDLSHNPRYISAMLQKVKDGAGVVIGSRYVSGGKAEGWALWRFLISRMANIYSRLILGLAVQDLTSGFKCLKKETLGSIDFSKMQSNGYAFQIEMAYLCSQRCLSIEEYPIVFFGRKKGKSKLSLYLLVEAFFLVLRLRFSRHVKLSR